MKKMLMACLIGIALLPASATVNGKTGFASFYNKRVVDVYLEGINLSASSDESTGTLVKIEIFKPNNEMVRSKNCSGYSCNLSLSGLASGSYTARVTTTLTTYEEGFSL